MHRIATKYDKAKEFNTPSRPMDRDLAAPVITAKGDEILHNNKIKKSNKKGLSMTEKAEKSHAHGPARTISKTELEEMTERTYRTSVTKIELAPGEPVNASTVKDSLKSKLKSLKSQFKRTSTMRA